MSSLHGKHVSSLFNLSNWSLVCTSFSWVLETFKLIMAYLLRRSNSECHIWIISPLTLLTNAKWGIHKRKQLGANSLVVQLLNPDSLIYLFQALFQPEAMVILVSEAQYIETDCWLVLLLLAFAQQNPKPSLMREKQAGRSQSKPVFSYAPRGSQTKWCFFQ